MTSNVIGISMKTAEDEGKEIKIKNLKEKVDIFMPMNLTQPDTRNVTFETGKSQHYMYQLHLVSLINEIISERSHLEYYIDNNDNDIFNTHNEADEDMNINYD